MRISHGFRQFTRPLCFLLVFALLVTLALPLYAAPQTTVKLNHALEANKPVLDFRVSPDGSRIVYRVARAFPPDQDVPPPPYADLYSVAATGGAAVRLNPVATKETESVESYQFSPDGSQIVFLRTTSDATLGNVFQLFRIPTDGSAAAVAVGEPIPVGTRSPRDFAFTIDQTFIQDGTSNTINFSLRHRNVPERITNIQDGSSNTFFFGEQANNLLQMGDGSVHQLNPDLVSGGVVYDFAITLDGTRAIYRADQNLDGAIELFSVPSDGSDSGFRISGPLVAGGDVQSFKVNATSARAVYLADQTTNGVTELYSARTNGGIVTKLNSPLTSGGNVTQFQFTPDGNQVVYLADQNLDERFQLFGVPTAGGSTPSPILFSLVGTANSVRSFLISPDGSRIFFVDNSGPGGTLRLYIRTVMGIIASITASGGPPVANLAVPDVKVTDDGERLVYLADNGNDGVYELTSITFTPSQVVVPQLNAPLVAGGNIRAFKISPDGERVVYLADQNAAGVFELFTVPIGGGSVERVSGALVGGGDVRTGPLDFQFSPDGRTVYYLADQDTDNLTELYAAFDAPVVEFTRPSYIVSEDGSLAPQWAVQRSGNLAAPSFVRVQLTGSPEGGTAKGGAALGDPSVDFVDNARDVPFASGEMTKTFLVPLQFDSVAEAPETFTMQLFEPEQAVIGAQETAEVTILDTDSSPLLEDASASLPENSATDTLVPLNGLSAAAVTTYTILSGNTDNAFRVDNSGALFVNNHAALNYETTPRFDLVVEARDDGGSYDLATWTIHLQDINELPIFLSQTRSIAENSLTYSLVGTKLAATDPDGDVLTFTLTSNIFSISANGQLRVKDGSKLDFETQPEHMLTISVSDGKGGNSSAAVRVTVLDVNEAVSTDPAISTLSPAAAVVGGKEFLLAITGQNFNAKSVVRWNGSERKTTLIKNTLYATITAKDIEAVTTAKVDVLDTGTKKASSVVAFRVVKELVGIPELTTLPSQQGSDVGVQTTFNLRWTHTTKPWRTMDEMELRLTDGELIPLWVRYQETRDENGADISTIILLNADGTPAGSGRFGEDKVLENETVRLDLAAATFTPSGNTGRTLVVSLPVTFKETAVQEGAVGIYTIEVYGVDDLGGEQGPNLLGTWQISRPSIYFPQVAK